MGVSLGKDLFPIYTDLTPSGAEFTEVVLPGSGFAFVDEAFDAKPVLNDVAGKGYFEPGKLSPRDYRARIRDSSSKNPSTGLGPWARVSSSREP